MDPKDMTDEELEKAATPQLEETATKTEEATAEPPKEEPAAEEPEQEPEQLEQQQEKEAEETEQPVESAEAEPQPMSRRKAERLENLIQKLQGTESRVPEAPKPPDYRDVMDAPDQVFEQVQNKTAEYGREAFNAGLEEAKSIRFHTRLEVDAPRIESKYPILDKESTEFNPAVASSINQWYLATVGYDASSDRVANANLRYSDFVEGIMELSENMASKQTAATKENIAKQAATTGLRPDGSSPKRLDLTKAPHEMTDEELEAATMASLPERDARGRFLRK